MWPIQKGVSYVTRFFLQDTSGNAVTGKVNGDFTKQISKGGAVGWSTMSPVTISEMTGGTVGGDGWYIFTLDSTHTDTSGDLAVKFFCTGTLQVNLEYRVGGMPLAELSVGVPSATPLSEEAIALLYMAMRNKLTTTSSLLSVHNDAGVVIAKATLSDNGSTFTREEMISG